MKVRMAVLPIFMLCELDYCTVDIFVLLAHILRLIPCDAKMSAITVILYLNHGLKTSAYLRLETRIAVIKDQGSDFYYIWRTLPSIR